jgi:hypothetical protein
MTILSYIVLAAVIALFAACAIAPPALDEFNKGHGRSTL